MAIRLAGKSGGKDAGKPAEQQQKNGKTSEEGIRVRSQQAAILLAYDQPFRMGNRQIQAKKMVAERGEAVRGCVVIKVYGAAFFFRKLRFGYFSGDRFLRILPEHSILRR